MLDEAIEYLKQLQLQVQVCEIILVISYLIPYISWLLLLYSNFSSHLLGN